MPWWALLLLIVVAVNLAIAAVGVLRARRRTDEMAPVIPLRWRVGSTIRRPGSRRPSA